MKKQVVLIPTEFANDLIKYLSSKPYSEVFTMIDYLSKLKAYDVDMPAGEETPDSINAAKSEDSDIGKDPLAT